jgi:hypothetical protein
MSPENARMFSTQSPQELFGSIFGSRENTFIESIPINGCTRKFKDQTCLVASWSSANRPSRQSVFSSRSGHLPFCFILSGSALLKVLEHILCPKQIFVDYPHLC